MFYGQLYTSFLHFHYRASFLRFATSLNNVRFVASVSLSAHHSPPAAHNFCVPFGLLRLRVCHTFCKEKSSKKICQTLASTELPHALRAFGSPPLQAHAPSSVSNSIGFIPARFAFGGQVCHLGSTAFFGSGLFYLRKKEEAVFYFPLLYLVFFSNPRMKNYVSYLPMLLCVESFFFSRLPLGLGFLCVL